MQNLLTILRTPDLRNIIIIMYGVIDDLPEIIFFHTFKYNILIFLAHCYEVAKIYMYKVLYM